MTRRRGRAVTGMGLVGCGVALAVSLSATAAQDTASATKRGQYLVETGACGDCHTPWKMGPSGPEPDQTLALSGHPAAMAMPDPPKPVGPWIMATAATNTAWAGPWGVSFTANLTPDKATGLGSWTEKMFVDSMRTGRHAGAGRQILPPMPWPAYKQMTDADLKAIFVYLQSIKPIKNAVPAPIPPKAPSK